MVYDAVAAHQAGVLSMASFAKAMGAVNAPERRSCHRPRQPFPVSQPSLHQPGGQLLITEALARAEGNQSIASRLLGISQPALSKRLETVPANLKPLRRNFSYPAACNSAAPYPLNFCHTHCAFSNL